MKFNKTHRGGAFSLVELLAIVSIIALLAALLMPTLARAQQTNMNLSNTGPYYSISNMVVIGSGTVLANDPILAGTVGTTLTNVYTFGTNYAGGNILPGGIGRALNVAFGANFTSTNSAAKGTETVYIDLGTGAGDWVRQPQTISVALSGTNIVSCSTNLNIGGFSMWRLDQITSTETNYTATATVGFSSKAGL